MHHSALYRDTVLLMKVDSCFLFTNHQVDRSTDNVSSDAHQLILVSVDLNFNLTELA